MICITVQHKSILNRLRLGGQYNATLSNVPSTILKRSYDTMSKEYGWTSCPIFLAPVDYRVNIYGAKLSDDSIGLVLNVPDEIVKIQRYYDWTDFIYYTEMTDEWDSEIPFSDFILSVLHPSDINKDDVVQVTVPYILENWILGIVVDLSYFSKYDGSGGKYILSLDEFEIQAYSSRQSKGSMLDCISNMSI